MIPRRLSLLGCLAAAALIASAPAQSQEAANAYDAIIRGGTIVDGSGLPPYRGDVAIKGGHIVAVGKLPFQRAETVIDATGLMVAPGFINIHSHARPDAIGTAVNMLLQGVTTEVSNADGHGTTDVSRQLLDFAAKGLAANIGLYIGFNAAWAEVVGPDDRRATPAEIERMRGLVDRNLTKGAWGVAAGLDYKPGYFADTDEVISVVSVARKWRTNFPNHDRIRPEEGYSSIKGMAETIAIGEQAGLVPVITHMKTQGVEQGNARAVLAMMDQATARGTYTAADLYPYLAGLSGLSLNVPGWAVAGGREAMLRRFADPTSRAKIVEEVEQAMKQRWGGPEGVYLFNTGEELADIIRRMNVRPGEAVVRLLEKQEHSAIFRFGTEADLVAFMKYRNSAIACDCGASLGDKGHPRTWGAFPRVLGKYVRDDRQMPLQDAIRKMGALPATIIGMNDRGYLLPGMAADITVFDHRTVQDHATYQKPTERSVGIRTVYVNGRLAVREGIPTGTQGGQIMLRTPHMPSRPMTLASVRRSMVGAGSVANYTQMFDVKVAVDQGPNQRNARGRVSVVDRTTGITWTSDQLGTIQTAPGWASLTGVLREPAGKLRPMTITFDTGDATLGAPRPTLVLRLDGGAEMSGVPREELRMVSR